MYVYGSPNLLLFCSFNLSVYINELCSSPDIASIRCFGRRWRMRLPDLSYTLGTIQEFRPLHPRIFFSYFEKLFDSHEVFQEKFENKKFDLTVLTVDLTRYFLEHWEKKLLENLIKTFKARMNVHSFIIRQRKRKKNKPRNSIHSRAWVKRVFYFHSHHFSLFTSVKPLMGPSFASPYHTLYPFVSIPSIYHTNPFFFKTFFRLRFLLLCRLS